MRCTSCRLRVDTIQGQILSLAATEVAFVEQPAVARESAGGHLRAQRGERGGAVVANREVIEDERLDVGAPCRRRAPLRWWRGSVRGDRARPGTSRRGPAGRRRSTSAGSIGIASPECANTTCRDVLEELVPRAVARRRFDVRLRQRGELRLQAPPRLDDAVAERGFVARCDARAIASSCLLLPSGTRRSRRRRGSR